MAKYNKTYFVSTFCLNTDTYPELKFGGDYFQLFFVFSNGYERRCVKYKHTLTVENKLIFFGIFPSMYN